MNPDAQQPPYTNRKKVTGRTKLALWLLIGPTALIAVCIISFSVANAVSGNIPNGLPDSCAQSALLDGSADTKDCTDSLFGKTTATESIINSILFTFMGIGVLTWFPGLIAGSVLLAKRPENGAPSQ